MARLNIYVHVKRRAVVLYPEPNFIGSLGNPHLKFGHGYAIHSTEYVDFFYLLTYFPYLRTYLRLVINF